MNLDLRGKKTIVFNKIAKAYFDGAKVIVNRGGTSSSKTVSIQQLIIALSFTKEYVNEKILITRNTLPSIKTSVLKDFQKQLDNLGVESLFHFHKTDLCYTNKQTGCEIYFKSSEEGQKKRGERWKLVEMNEANEISYDVFNQFFMRGARIIIDFNPSDPDVWINTEVEQKMSDIALIKSSYLDNHFLAEQTVKNIEYFRETNKEYWFIYGLGEYGNLQHKIFNNYSVISAKDYDRLVLQRFAGTDYGYIDPTTLVECKYNDGALYVREQYYKSYEKDYPAEVAKQLDRIKFGFSQPIYADHQPATNATIAKSGYKVINADKNIVDGLTLLRSLKIYVCETSTNLLKEMAKYSWQTDKNNKPFEEPVDFDNHAIDAMRYAAYTHLKGRIFNPAIKSTGLVR